MYRSNYQASYFSKYIFEVYKLFALYNRETALILVLNPSSSNAVLNRDSLNNINTNSSEVIMRIKESDTHFKYDKLLRVSLQEIRN